MFPTVRFEKNMPRVSLGETRNTCSKTKNIDSRVITERMSVQLCFISLINISAASRVCAISELAIV